MAATNTDLRWSLGLASPHRCCLSSSSFCWKIPQVEILDQVASRVWSSRAGLPRVSRRQMAFLLGVSPATRTTALVRTSRSFSSQLNCATSPSTRDNSQSRGAMDNHAQSLSRRRSFSLPCPGYDLYPRGGIFNVRVPVHTRAGSMSLGLSHLNRVCWLGVWPPLQISSQ